MKLKLGSFETVILLSLFLAILFRSPWLGAVATTLIILYLIKENKLSKLSRYLQGFLKRETAVKGVEVQGDLLRMGEHLVKALVIDEIPFDYRDVGDSELRNLVVAYNRVLDSVDNVNVVVVRKSIDKKEFVSRVQNKLQNLKVQAENDPSNERIRSEIRLLEKILRKIEEGESPFRYKLFFLVSGGTREEVEGKAEILKKGLSGLSLKVRSASPDEVFDALFFRSGDLKVALPSVLPLITPFVFTKYPDPDMISEGVFVGTELYTDRLVLWNLEKSVNPHLLVLGPTGSGKTEFLISTSVKIRSSYNVPVVLFDTKGDITERLVKYGVHFRVFNPLVWCPGVLELEEPVPQLKARAIEDVIASSFDLDEDTSSVLYKVLAESLESGVPSWSSVLRLLEAEDVGEATKARLRKVVSIVRELESGYPFNPKELEERRDILVVNLSKLTVEEAKRYVMLSLLTRIYSYFRKSVDRGLRVIVVLDEAWTAFSREQMRRGLILDMIKRGRGHGVAVFIATQNVSDFQGFEDKILDNVSNHVVLSNGDRKFWEEVVGRFVIISDEDIRNKVMYLKRGEALVRIANDPRPLLVRLDTFAS
ncbi:MAG: ATP-binding protein [Thermoprotei archaeon]